MPHRPSHPGPARRRVVALAVGLLGVTAAVTACTGAHGRADSTGHSSTGSAPAAGGAPGTSSTAVSAPAEPKAAARPKAPALTVTSVSPAGGSTAVATDTDVVVILSTALADGSFTPRITPAVAGTWSRTATASHATTLRFTPKAPWPASSRITVTVPGGLRSSANQQLRSSATASFVTEPLGIQRVQQLLARLGYLPLSFHVTGKAHTGNAAARADSGVYSWKWSSARAVLGGFWTAGRTNALTRAALMDFQYQHRLIADGVAGPQTSTALITDALARRSDPHPYNYVHVSKAEPETLTLYVAGSVRSHVAVSTGIKGATTYDGLFPVYEHVYYTRMRGTDVDGTKYDDKIYWASYFNGGEALHAYPRASYGFPQSNGCVEIQPSNAKKIWPLTPIGTPVRVTG